jgi:Tfp pilus assembly protein PilF
MPERDADAHIDADGARIAARPGGASRGGGRVRPLALALGLAACGPKALPPPPPPPVAPPAPTLSADARARYLEAAVAERRGEADRAEAALRWVTRLDRGDAWAWLHLGAFLERQRRVDEAMAAYEEALTRDEALADAHIALGAALVRGGEPERAVVHLARAADAEDPRGLHLYARALELLDDLDGADRALGRWLALPVEPAWALERARLAFELGRFDAAVDDLAHGVDWSGAPVPAGELLLVAATRACRLGTVWLWSEDEGVALHHDPRWVRVAERVRDTAATPPERCWRDREVPAGCAGAAEARALWEAAPFDPATLARWRERAAACPEPDPLPERVAWLLGRT